MPSFSHELLVELFRNAPRLARELLRQSAGIELPEGVDEVGSVDLSQVTSASYAADALVLVRHEANVVAVVIVEVQLEQDADKRLSWPAYLANARRQHACPAFLLVVCPDEQVAGRARQEIELGHPGLRLRPLVVGPASVPTLLGARAARELPELAVLVTLANPQEEVARAAIEAVGGLAEDRARLYFDVILAALPEAIRKALESWMQKYEYQSEFARKYLAEGRAAGAAEGRAAGVAAGKEEGRLEEARSSLLRVLARRGLAVPGEVARKIELEGSLPTLQRWLDAAVTAESLRDVFSDA